MPIRDAAGRVVEWIGAASDISERKLAEEKLRESDRRKDEFLAMLAHELRNSIAPVSAAAALLQRVKPDEALARRLRAEPDTAGAVLVAVTGYGQDSERQQIMAAGFDHHLVKPVDMERLEAILASAAQAHRAA